MYLRYVLSGFSIGKIKYKWFATTYLFNAIFYLYYTIILLFIDLVKVVRIIVFFLYLNPGDKLIMINNINDKKINCFFITQNTPLISSTF